MQKSSPDKDYDNLASIQSNVTLQDWDLVFHMENYSFNKSKRQDSIGFLDSIKSIDSDIKPWYDYNLRSCCVHFTPLWTRLAKLKGLKKYRSLYFSFQEFQFFEKKRYYKFILVNLKYILNLLFVIFTAIPDLIQPQF